MTHRTPDPGTNRPDSYVPRGPPSSSLPLRTLAPRVRRHSRKGRKAEGNSYISRGAEPCYGHRVRRDGRTYLAGAAAGRGESGQTTGTDNVSRREKVRGSPGERRQDVVRGPKLRGWAVVPPRRCYVLSTCSQSFTLAPLDPELRAMPSQKTGSFAPPCSCPSRRVITSDPTNLYSSSPTLSWHDGSCPSPSR